MTKLRNKAMKKEQNKRIRKGDKVLVIAGNDKGQVGTVMTRTKDRVVIKGVNVRKKAVKRTQANPQGGFIDIECPIHISNINLCVNDDKGVKLKVRESEQGRELVYKDGENLVPYRLVKKPGA